VPSPAGSDDRPEPCRNPDSTVGFADTLLRPACALQAGSGMDAAYVSAFAALAGSALGALTSISTSWLSQYVQFKTRLQASALEARQELYRTFIEEASRTYAHALEHDAANLSNLVALYALVSRMRITASPEIVESAESVLQQIIDTYLAPNKTLSDVRASLGEDALMDPLRRFADVCRHELWALKAIPPGRAGRAAARRAPVVGAPRSGGAGPRATREPVGNPTGASVRRAAPGATPAAPAELPATDATATGRPAACTVQTP
jgi:hypothetical protein